MATRPIVQRVCKCGCRELFYPPLTRPGQEYIRGHKPKVLTVASTPNQAAHGLRAHSIGRTDGERRTLDYRLALQTARREAADVATKIDAVDDVIASLREDLRVREAEKEMYTDRHLALSSTILALEACAEGKSLAREIASL